MRTEIPGHSLREVIKEFSETFGYGRQDMAAIRRYGETLNYTMMLLICCACEMLAWHRGTNAGEVFAGLVAGDKLPTSLGAKIYEVVRNGLAHRFRPNTVKIGKSEWRFRLYWKDGPALWQTKGRPNCLNLNVKYLQDRVIAQINDYEQELRTSESARLRFCDKSRKCVSDIHSDASRISTALNEL